MMWMEQDAGEGSCALASLVRRNAPMPYHACARLPYGYMDLHWYVLLFGYWQFHCPLSTLLSMTVIYIEERLTQLSIGTCAVDLL